MVTAAGRTAGRLLRALLVPLAVSAPLALAGCLALPDALPPADAEPRGLDAQPRPDRGPLDAASAPVDADRAPVDAAPPDAAPTPADAMVVEERCNGLDDDKDQLIDEGVINLCGVCGPLPDEVCDAIDNDCDYLIDEGVDCDCSPGTVEACSVDIGQCTLGDRLCEADGRWSSCSGAGAVIEACNGLDDDCDGGTDEGLLNACGECGTLPPEQCNSLDDDCDDLVDEALGGEACPLEGQGPCSVGRVTCRADEMICAQVVFAAPDVCNGLDDDCDGLADEGLDGGECVVDPAVTCAPGVYRCAEGRGACEARAEVRADGVDEDCDGAIDERPPELGVFDLADAVVGGLGLRPGAPPAVLSLPEGVGLAVFAPLPDNPFVTGVFMPRNNSDSTIDVDGTRMGFRGIVGGDRWSRLHAKGPGTTIDAPRARDYSDPLTDSVLEMHANLGITFDLEAIAAYTGRAPIRFIARAGNARDRAYTYSVVVDGERRLQASIGSGREVALSTDLVGARRLTLVLGDGDARSNSSRHTYFGNPIIELAGDP